MKTEMKELNLNEMEQVNGGLVWFIPAAVAVTIGVIAIVKTVKTLKK